MSKKTEDTLVARRTRGVIPVLYNSRKLGVCSIALSEAGSNRIREGGAWDRSKRSHHGKLAHTEGREERVVGYGLTLTLGANGSS